MSASDSAVIPIYILNVHPLLVENGLAYDIYYLTTNSKEQYCVRIFDVQLSFLVARLPGLNANQFTRLMQSYAKNMRTELRTDLVDGSYFDPSERREYFEFFSSNPYTLNDIHSKLYNDLEYFYRRLDVNDLSPHDKLFHMNTETPFRFTSTTLRIEDSPYFLSTKYNVPLVGGATLNTSLFTNNYAQEHIPITIKPEHFHAINAQSTKKWNAFTVNANISAAIQKSETVDFKQNMTMFAYDIETYNPEGILDPTIAEYYIFCIGIGIFNLNSQAPEERFCIISKDFDTTELSSGGITSKNDSSQYKLSVKRTTQFNVRAYIVDHEYVEESDSKQDATTYLIANNEKQLLTLFIEIIHKYHPQIITGFNSFGFDDNYVYERLKRYGLLEEFLQELTAYEIAECKKLSWFRSFMPVFKQFQLKIDNEMRQDNQSFRSPFVLTVDVYKLMLKEDPKRFTQYGRGNLNTMLEVYDVKNPFTSKPLSKTGLSIAEMYSHWSHNTNIYSIALYCCQDAWICGTLLVKRAKLADLIEMARISCTTLSDSLYKADGVRVGNSILNYAYNESFALMDSAFLYREKLGSSKNPLKEKDAKVAAKNKKVHDVKFGGKTFDRRTVVGGAVRNVHANKFNFIVALDFASMYPSAHEGNNVDSSSNVDPIIIEHPEDFGLNIVRVQPVNDMLGQREVYYVKLNK